MKIWLDYIFKKVVMGVCFFNKSLEFMISSYNVFFKRDWFYFYEDFFLFIYL